MNVADLQISFCHFGYMDLEWIVSTIREYNLPLFSNDVVDMIEEYSESTETPINKIDPCYILLDYIVQNSTLPDEIKDDLEIFSNYLDSSIQMKAPLARKIEKHFKNKDNTPNEYDEYIIDRASEF